MIVAMERRRQFETKQEKAMKATNTFAVLTLATAACAAIALGFYLNHSDEFAVTQNDATEEPTQLALSEVPFADPAVPFGSTTLETEATAADESMTGVTLEADDFAVLAEMSNAAQAEDLTEATEPRSIDAATLQEARVAFSNRDHDSVLTLLGDVGAVEGPSFEVHYLRSLTLRYVGRYEDSHLEMDAALALNPDNVRALVNSARTLLELERFVGAEERVQRALELDPNDADGWNVMGRAKLNLQEHASALEAFQRATELDTENAHAFNNLGYTYLQQKQWQAAAEALETAVQIRNDVAWFHNNLGVCYEQLDRPMAAAMAWQRAIELRPDYDKAHASLARITPRADAEEALLAGAEIVAEEPVQEQSVKTDGEETVQTGSDSQPQGDVVDVDGIEAGSDLRPSNSGSGATKETPESSVSPH